MKYGILLWPHANARYQTESARLARAELAIILRKTCPEAVVADEMRSDMNMLVFESENTLSDLQISRVAGHSLMYAMFELHGDMLRPVCGRPEAYLGADLPGILKYKGKTNEQFTDMVINTALYSSAFYEKGAQRLRFADPMCSRGTSLFLALNRGWDADGTDIDAADIRELNQFFKRYLEYHRIKHAADKKSYTMKNSKPVSAAEYTFADSAEAYKAGDTSKLRFAECDCGKLAQLFGKRKYHIMISDLPYGVQHSAGKETFEALLRRVMPAWREALLPGGAMALSFNTNTLRPALIREIMADSGLTVMQGGEYDGFAHWVEQAVTRDIAVAVRPE